MKFVLIDKIESLTSGSQIKTVKSVSLAEEYLADHFPAFPVLPGVFLLQGLIESATWLTPKKLDFSKSMVLLQRARNVKYKSFAAPGMKIQYTVTAKKIEDDKSSFVASGICGDEAIVEAKIDLRHFNLADRNAKDAEIDKRVIENLKQRFKLLLNK